MTNVGPADTLWERLQPRSPAQRKRPRPSPAATLAASTTTAPPSRLTASKVASRLKHAPTGTTLWEWLQPRSPAQRKRHRPDPATTPPAAAAPEDKHQPHHHAVSSRGTQRPRRHRGRSVKRSWTRTHSAGLGWASTSAVVRSCARAVHCHVYWRPGLDHAFGRSGIVQAQQFATEEHGSARK
jgi:hypothetical protein